MIDLKQFKGFSLDTNDTSPEAKQLLFYALTNGITVKKYSIKRHEQPPVDLVPCGSVEYCETILGYHVKPDYYPEWLSGMLYRKVWRSDEWILGERYFVKPADRFKRFNGFTTKGTYSKKKKPPYWYSEIISFDNEWRYYISNGKNLGGWWYQGSDKSEPTARILEWVIDIPESFIGTIDMGETLDRKFALVECHPPFACGWYGSSEEIEIYLQWLIDGWEYIGVTKKATPQI